MTTPCYIFDIDGTLSDPTHRLHYIQGDVKDWDAFFSAVGDDPVHEHVADVLYALEHTDNHIVIVSGRSDQCREETVAWFDINGIPYYALYMRRAGDHRPDYQVKRDLLVQLRRDGYEPVMVFDDRKKVVDMWRAEGIPCAQVAPGNF